eukprot:4817787-Amphidinium_carterae.1
MLLKRLRISFTIISLLGSVRGTPSFLNQKRGRSIVLTISTTFVSFPGILCVYTAFLWEARVDSCHKYVEEATVRSGAGGGGGGVDQDVLNETQELVQAI